MTKEQLDLTIAKITAARYVDELSEILKTVGIDGIKAEAIANEDGSYNGIVEVQFNMTYSKEDVDIISTFEYPEENLSE